MAELLVDFITSLDGYASAEGWPGWWGLQGPEYMAWLGEIEATEGAYTMIMGANTYRVMSELMSGVDANLSPDEAESGDVMMKASKIVFSSTLKEPLSWQNTRLISSDAVEAVRQLKADGTSLRTLGSLSLCRSLLKAGLVDRFRVGIFPVITGATGSERIYDGYPDVALDMISSKTFDGRILMLEYKPRVLSGPPGENSSS